MSSYTIATIEDAPDVSGDAPGEMRMMRSVLETEQLALTYRVVAPGTALVPPGWDPGAGHNHKTQEEIYYVLSGNVRMKLDDDVVELGPNTAVRIAPETVRCVRNDTDEPASLLMLSQKVDDLRADVEFHGGFWTD